MTIPEELRETLDSNPKIISGAVRFIGTRVPVQALLDSLAHGLPVSDFLEGFPDVSEEQASAIVRWQQNPARQAFGLHLLA